MFQIIRPRLTHENTLHDFSIEIEQRRVTFNPNAEILIFEREESLNEETILKTIY
jgi:hypothetical protein